MTEDEYREIKGRSNEVPPYFLSAEHLGCALWCLEGPAARQCLRRAYQDRNLLVKHIDGLDDFRCAAIRLRAKIQEAATCAPFAVKQAQILKVCRFCGEDDDAHGPGNPFIMNYGEEYAHQACMEAAGLTPLPVDDEPEPEETQKMTMSVVATMKFEDAFQGFKFSIGDAVFIKSALHTAGNRPKQFVVYEQLAQRCDGGIQFLYKLVGWQGDLPEIALTAEEPPYRPESLELFADRKRIALCDGETRDEISKTRQARYQAIVDEAERKANNE